MQRICNEPAAITIPDIKDAEVSAMTQAMYSRSNTRIKVRLEELDAEGEEKAKEALKKFYLGYGHASINDCGFTTIFAEGISNILAKAIEDTPLFNGQESSTRYLDYATQSIIDPYKNDSSRKIIEGWLLLYTEFQPKVVDGLKRRYPIGQGEDEGDYGRAIKARSFDIMRGYLPAGVTTQVSWTTSLRHARDRIRFLIHHPVEEVREVIKAIHAALLEKYPSSFKASDIEPTQEYKDYYGDPEFHYIDTEKSFDIPLTEVFGEATILHRASPNYNLNPPLIEKLANRPEHAVIPTMISNAANFYFVAIIDFGSYRDIQRHRNGHCPIPVIKDYGFGINQWYKDEIKASLSEEDNTRFDSIVDAQMNFIEVFKTSDLFQYDVYLHQYLYPMGINIVTEFNYNFGQCVYVSELRSQPTVHETLRPIAQHIGNVINDLLDAKVCRINEDEGAFNIARGKQTIFKDGVEIS